MRRFLSWRWCVAHLCLLVAIAVMLRLGWWQWDRANSHSGGMQNYAYALQWPLFAIFATVVYVKTMREDLRRPIDGTTGRATPMRFDPAASGVRHEGGVRIGVSTPAVVIDPDDDETAEWNARLAALNAATARMEERARGR